MPCINMELLTPFSNDLFQVIYHHTKSCLESMLQSDISNAHAHEKHMKNYSFRYKKCKSQISYVDIQLIINHKVKDNCDVSLTLNLNIHSVLKKGEARDNRWRGRGGIFRLIFTVCGLINHCTPFRICHIWSLNNCLLLLPLIHRLLF